MAESDGQAERERLREAVERGEMTPEEAVVAWPNGPARSIVAEAARRSAEIDREWREAGWREAGSVPEERAGWGLDDHDGEEKTA